MTEAELREQMVSLAHSLFMRGYSSGGAGNISCRLPDGGFLVTPTNSSFGALDPERLSKLDEQGEWVAGDKPSKEAVMHRAFYRERPQTGGVVHLHSPSLTALSCLPGLDAANCLPPITPYYVMRVGTLPLVPYFRPGDPALAQAIGALAPSHNAMLLANHGPVVGGGSLREAVFNAEELEDTARLYFTLLPHGMVTLTAEQIHELNVTFKRPA
ncbi:L-fuculose phosphate aldolase [Sodalis praecaptivus]|uniref:3-oxo-tetronate 4-phosphate decarboxylase n=1 Tax=Sodalis praecaptivus TaxID=1239307 RepID=W0HYL9_9GAMM|nr:aldolase [Sodalis praecaptivus]AHF77315.1 L-fuculose phosphate aldolase [Sodalis praecaptivus]